MTFEKCRNSGRFNCEVTFIPCDVISERQHNLEMKSLDFGSPDSNTSSTAHELVGFGQDI